MKKIIVAALQVFLLMPLLSFSQEKINKIERLMASGRLYEAENYTKERLYKDSTRNISYLYYMGEIYRSTGLYDVAMKYFNRAIGYDSNSALVIAGMGVTLAQQGDTAHALLKLNRAIQIDTKNETFYNDRGGVYLIMQKYTLALNDYRSAYHLDSTSNKVFYNLGLAFSHVNDTNNAIYYLTQAIQGNKCRLTYFERARAYYRFKMYNKAIDDYNTAFETKNTENPYENVADKKLYEWRALAYRDKGDDADYKKDMYHAEHIITVQ